MTTLRVGLGQVAPQLGMVDDNLATHRRVIDEARARGIDLLVFPELGLTGYLLQDLNSEVAMRADDQRLAQLGKAGGDMSVVLGFVEESDDHQLYISAALFEGGELRHVYRKSYLPNYGLFDERRFFGAGTQIRAVDSRLGVRLGISICEDFWHLPTPYLLALDGAQVLINIASSPGRGCFCSGKGGVAPASRGSSSCVVEFESGR